MNWISLNGRNRGEYWLLKSDRFHVDLQPISETFTGGITAKVSDAAVGLQPELSLEELVRQAKPAVVYLKGLDKTGSGFFVTGTGVIVTNAHLARGEETLLTLLSTGQQLEAKVVHVDPDLDIALAKVERPSGKSEFPHLTLTDAASVHQGENVLAIGNPGDAMLFSVTKGIVSAVGTFPTPVPALGFRPTLPSIPGSSGGPLLNSRGEVIGINSKSSSEKRHWNQLRPQRHRSSRSSPPLLSQRRARSPKSSPPPRVNQPPRPQASPSQTTAPNPPSRRRSLHRLLPMGLAQSLFPRTPTAPKSLSMTNSSAMPPPL